MRAATPMGNNPTRCVLLADRHHRLSEGLREWLEPVCGSVFVVADPASLLEGAQRLDPALVVVDLALAQGALADLLAALRARAPAAKLLLLSLHDEPAVARAAAAAGADGLVSKRALATDLLPAAAALLAGRPAAAPNAGVPTRPVP